MKHQITGFFACLIIASGITGCSSIAYYAQSINGQLEILGKRVAIDDLLDDAKTPARLRNQLLQVKAARAFATQFLHLPDNDSYRYYADLQRSHVVWNVFATPELSLENRQWCFPVAGCLEYRGYFSREAAEKYAHLLESDGMDTYIGAVTAYSTLGWFNDPVLNTMFERDADYLMKVMFHELAHQRIYVKHDTGFNEAFAETVAIEGVRRWHSMYGTNVSLAAFMTTLSREEQFIELVLKYRNTLDGVYRSNSDDDFKRLEKARLFQEMTAEYQVLRHQWGNDETYDAWFNTGLNNARLSAVSTYRDNVPAFRVLLEKSENDLTRFYNLVELLGKCAPDNRKVLLLAGNTNVSC